MKYEEALTHAGLTPDVRLHQLYLQGVAAGMERARADFDNLESARKASAETKRLQSAFCKEMGISKPGKNYKNVNLEEFLSWRAKL